MSAARVSTARAPAAKPANKSGANPPGRPAPRAAARTPMKPANPAAIWSRALAGWVYRRPVPVLISVAVAGIVGSVGWNALMLQTVKHPAPLFGAKPAEVAHRPDPAPLPAPRPADVAAAPAASASDRPGKPAGDPIAGLIRGDAPKLAGDAQRIGAAQTALTKLNYGPLKSDGLMGAGTKGALERFEREHNLPVTGSLAPRTVKALAQQSGIAVE